MAPPARPALLAVAATLVLAGCLGGTAPGATSPDGTTTTSTATTTTTTATITTTTTSTTTTETTAPQTSQAFTPSPLGPALADCEVPEPVSPTPTTEPGTRSGTGDLPGGLEVRSAYDGNLTVVLRRLPYNVTTFARRYGPDAGTIDLGPEMADKSGYWTVVVADCEVVWSRPVRDYESVTIRVDRNGNVSVVSYSVA